jgi:hypothetical protein
LKLLLPVLLGFTLLLPFRTALKLLPVVTIPGGDLIS